MQAEKEKKYIQESKMMVGKVAYAGTNTVIKNIVAALQILIYCDTSINIMVN